MSDVDDAMQEVKDLERAVLKLLGRLNEVRDRLASAVGDDEIMNINDEWEGSLARRAVMKACGAVTGRQMVHPTWENLKLYLKNHSLTDLRGVGRTTERAVLRRLAEHEKGKVVTNER